MKYHFYSTALIALLWCITLLLTYIVSGASGPQIFAISAIFFITWLVTISVIVQPAILKHELKTLSTRERNLYQTMVRSSRLSASRRRSLVKSIEATRRRKEWIVNNPEAAESGDRDAQLALGMALQDLGRQEEAEVWIRRAAEQNEPDAQMMVGAALMSKADEDPEAAIEALKWLMLAIASGHNHPWMKANEAPIFAQKLREGMTQEQLLEAGERARRWRPTDESE